MKISRLRKKANKIKDPTDIIKYKKQRNYVVNLNKEARLEYFSKYESNDNKPFWINYTNASLKLSIVKLILEN